MGRPKTIVVDRAALLTGILRETALERAALQADVDAAAGTYGTWANGARYQLLELERNGIRIDFERFIGRALTASERLRHQQALRELEAADLVSIFGLKATRVRLTPKGLASLGPTTIAPAPVTAC